MTHDPKLVEAILRVIPCNEWPGAQEIVIPVLDAICAHLRIPPEALRALTRGEAVVVNIGEVTCQAEVERDELFNRLGRVTEELGLPVDATASRIIEAIDERVDAEREACASLDVRVEVPADAETWTPLEAWEEALIALNEEWRAAVRGRAASPYARDVLIVGEAERNAALAGAIIDAALKARKHNSEVLAEVSVMGCAVFVRAPDAPCPPGPYPAPSPLPSTRRMPRSR